MRRSSDYGDVEVISGVDAPLIVEPREAYDPYHLSAKAGSAYAGSSLRSPGSISDMGEAEAPVVPETFLPSERFNQRPAYPRQETDRSIDHDDDSRRL